MTTRCHRRSPLLMMAAFALIATTATGQNPAGVPPDVAAETRAAEDPTSTTAANIQFNFEGVAWREVIKWIADEAELALHFSDLPTGSFTYADQAVYTQQGAIDRINLFLLPQGYTLVRSGKLLSVINLGDPRSMQQLDALAELVTVDQLAELSNHDVVKCLFPLGELTSEDAVQELTALNLMTTPAVFSKTNQLLITDTAGKLRNVKQILDAFRPTEMGNGTVVKAFVLKHVEAEDVLTVARPHLGLATGEMIGIDVSISADLLGKNIFVTGIEDKVKLIEGLVTAIDQPSQADTGMSRDAKLQSHLVAGGNVETVYNVLQTLMAGKSIRLSMDEAAGSIVALAPPEVQSEIAATVEQLQASEADFEVIPLKSVDPYFAISLLEEMLDLPDSFDDPEDIDPDAPKIDADPGNMRLFVRAKRPQIEQIKKIVAGLDQNGTSQTGDSVRIFPLKGEHAERVLETAAKFWRGENPIVLFRSDVTEEPLSTERVVHDDERPGLGQANRGGRTLTSNRLTAIDLQNQRWLTDNLHSDAPTIRCQLTARGLLLQSEDVAALDLFEDHLRTIMGPSDTMPSPPIVFYLKYTKAVDALKMLAELLDGGESASEGEAGTLVNGYVSSSSSDSYLGSIVTSRDGTTTMIAGSITVVADGRLNRLIAQGTATDIERIEGYLNIIDKDGSITSVETYGSSHVIELYNSKASEVAVALQGAFAGRVAGGFGATAQRPGQGGTAQPARQGDDAPKAAQAKTDSQNSKKSPEKKPAGRAPQSSEPQMTIAVHEASNSLIVTAPEQLFREVENLARSIDERGAQSVEVVAPMNGELIELVLQQVLLGEAVSGRRPSTAGSSTPNASSPRPKNGR